MNFGPLLLSHYDHPLVTPFYMGRRSADADALMASMISEPQNTVTPMRSGAEAMGGNTWR